VIALRDHLPLLRSQEGEKPLRSRWLCNCLRAAAEKAGYENWWLAEHVTESVFGYLTSCYSANTIEPAVLSELVLSALTVIGYSEVGSRFALLPPPFELSLADLARESGPGYELGFFSLLSRRIRPALAKPQSCFQLSELQGCVRYLRSVKNWTPGCSKLRNEIVDFVRDELVRIDGQTRILLTIR
jgi:hypothetical protein